MDQNNNILEEEKRRLAKSAFARFKKKINILLKRQSGVFKRITKRINKRKLKEPRKEMDGLYEDKNK
ncbi:MAG: hypothetical protein KAQ64_01790 [Candidatus Pacebacteria bacterium]|nr:hypothetical protein [Candidatus Paceibacterota bacterium]